MKLKGNRGEWSEFYAFVKLLSLGRLYDAGDSMALSKKKYFPVLKILRTEKTDFNREYVINPADGSVEVHGPEGLLKKLPRSLLEVQAHSLYERICECGDGEFEIPEAEEIMQALACSEITAPSGDKTAILMQIHDIYNGLDPVCGFGIRSELATSHVLLSASEATNFIFEVIGLNDEQMAEVNSIETRTKIIDRIAKIYEYGSLEFRRVNNLKFAGNLMMIDSWMERIVGDLLLDYYRNNVGDCRSLVERQEERNPLGYPRKGMYEFKFRKFLCSIALGMVPSKPWDGHDEANGGYVIVKKDGDVVAYHIYNRDDFESYLLNKTEFDRGSTTRHHFASIYKGEDGKMYFNLNLQIRFI